MVRSRRMPGWALPVVGGVLFTVLVLAWATSSLWFFTRDRRDVVSGLRKVATGVEAVVLVAVVLMVVLLFANDPTSPPPLPAEAATAAPGSMPPPSTDGPAPAATAATDPAASARAVRRSCGRARSPIPPPRSPSSPRAAAACPAFAGRLTDEEIAAVVEYTRSALAGG